MPLFNRNAPISNIGSELEPDLSPEQLSFEKQAIAAGRDVLCWILGAVSATAGVLAFIGSRAS